LGGLLEPADETGDDRMTPEFLLAEEAVPTVASSYEKVKSSIPCPEWEMRPCAPGRQD